MSKYSDKKKKQLELQQSGIDVFAANHGFLPPASTNNHFYNDNDEEDVPDNDYGYVEEIKDTIEPPPSSLPKQEVDSSEDNRPVLPDKPKKNKSNNKITPKINNPNITEEQVKRIVNSFKNGKYKYVVTHKLNGNNRNFCVRADTIEEVQRKLRPFNLDLVDIVKNNQIQLFDSTIDMPKEIIGVPCDKWIDQRSKEAYQNINKGAYDFAINYSKEGVSRFSKLRANSIAELFNKLRTFGIKPMKVYQQCPNNRTILKDNEFAFQS